LPVGSKVQGSEVQGSAQPLAAKSNSLIEKETLKKRISNIEQGITNVEVRYSIIFIFEKRLSAAIPHFIIRYFLFDILRFAV
jgi:hypothetical protein